VTAVVSADSLAVKPYCTRQDRLVRLTLRAQQEILAAGGTQLGRRPALATVAFMAIAIAVSDVGFYHHEANPGMVGIAGAATLFTLLTSSVAIMRRELRMRRDRLGAVEDDHQKPRRVRRVPSQHVGRAAGAARRHGVRPGAAGGRAEAGSAEEVSESPTPHGAESPRRRTRRVTCPNTAYYFPSIWSSTSVFRCRVPS